MKLKTFMLALCYAIIPILVYANPERIKFTRTKIIKTATWGA